MKERDPLARLAALSRRHAEPLRWTLTGIALGCMVGIGFAWRAGFPGSERAEVALRLSLSGLALALWSLSLPPVARADARRWTKPALVLAALLATLGYFNFGRFHGRGFVHHWEQFHYALNAKYYPELGHDGLYAASLEAQEQAQQQVQWKVAKQRFVRDLRTNKVVPSDSAAMAAQRAEVRGRFTPERWEAFVVDHLEFLGSNSAGYLEKIRKDHGFNPPPSWTFVARRFADESMLDARQLVWLGCLDAILLALLFAAIFHAYGLEIGCLALWIFGLNYAGRFFWVGGAFLREDWLAAIGIGVCMLRRERFVLAGALFAYGAMVRLFPVLFLFGPGVVALRQIVLREDWRWARRFAGGFAFGVALMFGLGCLAGRGLDGWGEFADTIGLHGRTWLTNNVGLDNVVLYGIDDFRRVLVDFDLPEPWIHWQARMDGLRAARAPLLWGARLLFLGLLALACWRARPDEAAILSLGCVFALVLSTCYYWQALLLLALLGSRRVSFAVLLLNLGLHALHFASGAFELRYGLMSWALLALFVSIYAPRARETLRRGRSARTAGAAAA